VKDKKKKAEYDAKWHRRQRKFGLCGSHRNIKAMKGKTYCKQCLIDKRLTWLRRIGMPEKEIKRARLTWNSFDNRCFACGSRKSGTKGWVTDHDHKTLKFRGILCSGCNIALGYVRDSVIRLKFLIAYLMRK
jgi:hypothetical protein